MIYGYHNNILRVDLTTGLISSESHSDEFWRKYIGGRNYIAYTLLTELPSGISAFDPENIFICATGPLTGTNIAGGGRHSVGAKSPLTGGYGDAEAGGFWGAMFHRTGFDSLIVQGKSAEPIYLWINNGKVEIRSAKHLVRQSTYDVQKKIQDELHDSRVKVMQCGKAGENLVRYACVLNDVNRSAGRTGLGSVMGSKNLKAIAVLGDKMPQLAKMSELQDLQNWLMENYQKRSAWAVEIGTPSMVEILQELGGLPTRNFREGRFEGAESIGGTKMHQEIVTGRDTCYACPIRCKQVVEIKNKRYNVDPQYGGPEYETLCAFGANCGVDDLHAVAKANELCASAGLDTISTGSVVAFAMECFERGIINQQDADGLELRFGNAAAMITLIGHIINREGLGDVLAEGVARASYQLGRGADELAMHVKGQELPMHEPRFKQGMGLGYTVSPTGADHEHNIHDTDYTRSSAMERINKSFGLNIPAMKLDDLDSNKVTLFMYETNWRHFVNCLVMCYFMPYGYERTHNILNAITGFDVSIQDCLRVGERAVNLARIFNLREGINSVTDKLPERMYGSLLGTNGDIVIDREKMHTALQNYYRSMGWHLETGLPTASKLKELGLDDFIPSQA